MDVHSEKTSSTGHKLQQLNIRRSFWPCV